MNIQKNGYLSIEQLTDRYLNGTREAENHRTTEGLSFQDILQKKSLTGSTGSLKFSKHALGRLTDRCIPGSIGAHAHVPLVHGFHPGSSFLIFLRFIPLKQLLCQ